MCPCDHNYMLPARLYYEILEQSFIVKRLLDFVRLDLLCAICISVLSGLLLVLLGLRGQVWYRGWEVPRMLLLGLSKRSIPKQDQRRNDIIHQELLDTDML